MVDVKNVILFKYNEIKTSWEDVDIETEKELLLNYSLNELFYDSELKEKVEKQFRKGLISACEYMNRLNDIFNELMFNVEYEIHKLYKDE